MLRAAAASVPKIDFGVQRQVAEMMAASVPKFDFGVQRQVAEMMAASVPKFDFGFQKQAAELMAASVPKFDWATVTSDLLASLGAEVITGATELVTAFIEGDAADEGAIEAAARRVEAAAQRLSTGLRSEALAAQFEVQLRWAFAVAYVAACARALDALDRESPEFRGAKVALELLAAFVTLVLAGASFT